MKKIAYLCDTRALVIQLTNEDWVVTEEFAATSAGAQELSAWLAIQRRLSVNVVLDFSEIEFDFHSLPAMSVITRLRYRRAISRQFDETNGWWGIKFVRSSASDTQLSIARVSTQQTTENVTWAAALNQNKCRISVISPAAMIVGAGLVRQSGDTCTLLCARCANMHYWHLLYENDVLQYIRVLPLQKTTYSLLQQLRETLQYLQDQRPGREVAPKLLVTEDIAFDANTLNEGLGSLVTGISVATQGADGDSFMTQKQAEFSTTITQRHLIDYIAANPSIVRQFQLTRSQFRKLLSRKRIIERVSQPVLISIGVILVVTSVMSSIFGYSFAAKLERNNATASALTLAISQTPVSPQDMRDTVLLHESLVQQYPSPINLLYGLSEAVSEVPELELKSVEWLMQERSISEAPGSPGGSENGSWKGPPIVQIAESLVAERYAALEIDSQSQLRALVRVAGNFLTNGESVSESYARYKKFSALLTKHPQIKLLTQQEPYDSASANAAVNSGIRAKKAGFAVLLDYPASALGYGI